MVPVINKEGEFHQNIVFFVSNTSKYNTFWIKLKYQAINTWWITALVGDGAGSKKVAAVEMLCRRSSGLSIVSEGTLLYTVFCEVWQQSPLGTSKQKAIHMHKIPWHMTVWFQTPVSEKSFQFKLKCFSSSDVQHNWID